MAAAQSVVLLFTVEQLQDLSRDDIIIKFCLCFVQYGRLVFFFNPKCILMLVTKLYSVHLIIAMTECVISNHAWTKIPKGLVSILKQNKLNYPLKILF